MLVNVILCYCFNFETEVKSVDGLKCPLMELTILQQIIIYT